MALLLLPLPGTLLITLAQDSRHKGRAGIHACSELQVKINLKEKSWMGETALDR